MLGGNKEFPDRNKGFWKRNGGPTGKSGLPIMVNWLMNARNLDFLFQWNFLRSNDTLHGSPRGVGLKKG